MPDAVNWQSYPQGWLYRFGLLSFPSVIAIPFWAILLIFFIKGHVIFAKSVWDHCINQFYPIKKRSTFLNASFSNRLTLSIFCSIHPLILQWFHTRPIARWELPLSDQTAGMLHTDGYIRIFYPPHAVRLRMSAYRHLLLPVGNDTSLILRFDSVTVLRFHFYNYVNFLTIKFY